MGYFLRCGTISKLFWGLFVQLNNSMFPSIMTVNFDLVFGSSLAFWGLNGLLIGQDWV